MKNLEQAKNMVKAAYDLLQDYVDHHSVTADAEDAQVHIEEGIAHIQFAIDNHHENHGAEKERQRLLSRRPE